MALGGDFIGFTFNGVHSSEMGIIRTSDGSRFNENLLPAFTDKTVQVPGGDGVYYFGSNYTQRQISIPIATDELTEKQFRRLKQWLGDKEIHELIFDEAPYKTYMVKTSGNPTIKFICFDNKIVNSDGNITKERVYKGEGSLQFIAYFPFARCKDKYLNQYKQSNKNEWAAASGLREQGEYDGKGATIKLYNPGDLEADFCAYYSKENINNLSKVYIDSNILNFNFSGDDNTTDAYIRINSKTNLIEGCDDEYKPTGTLYNKFITSGDFFKIPLGESEFVSSGANCEKIEYDYLYY